MLINTDAGTACDMQYNFVVDNRLLIRDSKIGGSLPFLSEENMGEQTSVIVWSRQYPMWEHIFQRPNLARCWTNFRHLDKNNPGLVDSNATLALGFSKVNA